MLCAGLFMCHTSGHVCSSPLLARAYVNSSREGKASLLCGLVLFLSSVTKTTHWGVGGGRLLKSLRNPHPQKDGPAALFELTVTASATGQ